MHGTEKGLVDADLGGGVVKQRIARIGQGRSKGYRTIIILRHGERSFFVFGFSKNNRESLRKDEEEEFRNLSGHLLSLSENLLSELSARGDFVEVEND
ncbi:MAG: type II toxin-antitoxin system RelE/ParE family toxin [Alphaproteobacteria bacterium]